MVNHIEAFGQVQQAEKGNFSLVERGKDMVGYGRQRGFCRVVGAETVLVRRKEMVVRKVGVELLVDSSLYNSGDDGNNGDRTEVGWVRGITGFQDRVDQRVLPG